MGKQSVVTGMGTWHHVTWHCSSCSHGPGVNLSTHCLSQPLGLVVQSMHKCMRQPAVSSQLYLGYPSILYSLDSFKRSSHHKRKEKCLYMQLNLGRKQMLAFLCCYLSIYRRTDGRRVGKESRIGVRSRRSKNEKKNQ